ncbi:MAG TPA: anthranilate phosphoribosyltransferase [Nitrososphaeraceae archaeon]|nr:anthranilate phosphoribosyltransferase [Nitrososphaeraceae archaeon]
MGNLSRIIQKLVSGADLSDDELIFAMSLILQGKVSEASIASFLVALRMKGETAHELNAIVQTIKKYAIRITPKIGGFLIDTCGTGGGQINTFNISTASAIIASSAGAKVAKHGNRSASGLCGSADFMEYMGFNLGCPVDDILEGIQQTGLGFLYAPKFHPAMQNVASARRTIGIRTVFNIIGPLTNPCTNLCGQIIGAPDSKIIETLALSLKGSDLRDIMLVSSKDGLDELSNTCENDIARITGNEIKRTRFHPREVGLELARLENLVVYSKEEAIRDTLRVICGIGDRYREDIAVLNASAALVVGHSSSNLKEGVELARQAIRDERARKQLSECIRRCGQKQVLIEAEKKFL